MNVARTSTPELRRAGVSGPVKVAGLFFVSAALWWGWSPVATLLWLFGLVAYPYVQRGASRRSLRFTREGRTLVALCLGVGFAALNTGNNLLYLVLGMLLSLIVVSGVLSELTLRRLSPVRQLPREVVAGQPFLTGVSLTNAKRWVPSFSVFVEDELEGLVPEKRCYFLKIPAQSHQLTSYRYVLPRRGRWRYVRLRIGTRFPFSFFVKSHLVEAHGEIIALPRIWAIGELPGAWIAGLNEAWSAQRGPGQEFYGLRDYRVGESARRIHWKRTARQGRPIVRQTAEDGRREITVILNDLLAPWEDQDGPILSAELDECVELAASLVAHLSRKGAEVVLHTSRQRLLVHPDGQGLDVALRALALVDFVSPETHALPEAMGYTLLVTHRRSSRYASGSYERVLERGG